MLAEGLQVLCGGVPARLEIEQVSTAVDGEPLEH
jgi:hypothetical protein